MELPEKILYCIDTLERASFPVYAVGGCVRDWLLGREPHDFDLCTAARPDQIQALFSGHPLVLAGMKHGTVGVVLDHEVVEITTFRTEGDYTDGRHPDQVRFVEDVDQDLSRRDFTVNAMAWSPTRGLADPFGGQTDLQKGILRAVGDPEQRFREDPLRILRGVRFAVRYGLIPDPATEKAMQAMAPLMDGLSRERVFDELCKLLPLVAAEDLIRYATVITQPIPELASAIGFDQCSPHHAYDLYTHTAHVTAAVPEDLTLRWAALLHDVGKVPTFTRDENGRGHFYGHAKVGAPIADQILHRLRAPTDLRTQVVTLVEQHMIRLEPDRKLLRRRLSRFGKERTEQLLLLQTADMGSKGTGHEEELTAFHQVRQLLDELYGEDTCLTIRDLAIDGTDLLALGFPADHTLGQCLRHLLEQVVDETLPNERNALLAAASCHRS